MSKPFHPMDDIKQMLADIGSSMTPEDFAFTVVALGAFWDCYRFVFQGTKGMLAFRQLKEGEFEIGFLRKGEWGPEEIVEAIKASGPN